MLRWEDFANIVHHHLWERRAAKVAVRVRRRLERWRDRAKTDGRPDLLPQARTPKETRMSDAVETPTIAPAALGRVFFSKLDPETAQALRAAITEELLGLVKDEAVHEARAQLEAEFTDRQERLLDDLQAQRQQIERDAAAEADHAAAQQLALDEQDFTDRLDSVRGRVRDWRGRAEIAEALVMNLLTQLCGGVDYKAVYLYSGGEGLRELDLHAANAVLGRVGLRLKSEQRASARTVATVVEPGKTVAHSRFKVVKTLAPGVVDEDAEEG